MSTYGYTILEKVGTSIQVCADGNPEMKAGGVTLAWAAIAAASASYEVNSPVDGATGFTSFLGTGSLATDYVTAGEKFLRYGTVLCRIVGGTYDGKFAPYGTASGSLASGALSKAPGDMFITNESVHEANSGSDHPPVLEGGKCWKHRLVVNYATIQTLTMTASGGTFTLSYKGQTTSSLAYNANAATVQAALEALSTIGAGKATVSLSGSVYTITLAASLGVHDALTVAVGSLTGGSATLGTAADTLSGPTLTELRSAFPRVTLINEL
jgi:hypothetical protein